MDDSQASEIGRECSFFPSPDSIEKYKNFNIIIDAIQSGPVWSCGRRCYIVLDTYALQSGPVWSCGRRRYIVFDIYTLQSGPVRSCGLRRKTPEWSARVGQRQDIQARELLGIC